MNLENLPDIALQQICSYLTYNQIAENRIVSTKFNELGKEMLNRGYKMMEKFHRKSLITVKSRLPRRESERKTHPLSRQCEILIAIETRLSMLSMTFSRFIEGKKCCFIPGKVVDEIFKVLRIVNSLVPPPRDVLQELRDISSMAMEHFDEKIAPSLKMSTVRSNIVLFDPQIRVLSDIKACTSLYSIAKQMTFNSRCNNKRVYAISRQSKRIYKKIKRNNKLVSDMRTVISEQGRKIRSLSRIIQSYETKFRELSAEVRGLSRQRELDSFPISGDSLKEDSSV